jgi:hypothetical protein
MNCLEKNIVGLTKNECPCFADKPSGSSTSLSGLYVDELVTLSDIKKLENCEHGSMWKLMENSIDEAVSLVEEDLISCVKEKVSKSKVSCSKLIGGWKHDKNLTQSTTYAGLKVTFWNLKGATAILRGINTIFSATGTLNAKIIFKNLDIEEVDVVLNTTTNGQNQNNLAEIIELFQYSEYCDNIEMYVIYEVNQSNLARNNEVDCGCGKTANCWEDFVKIEGVSGSDLVNIHNWNTTRYAEGLMLDMTFRCKEENVICDGQIDFTDNYGRNIARAIQYFSAFRIYEKLYYSNEPSIWTTVGKEDLEVMLPRLETKYKEYLAKICSEIDLSNTDCFVCKDNWGVKHTRVG